MFVIHSFKSFNSLLIKSTTAIFFLLFVSNNVFGKTVGAIKLNYFSLNIFKKNIFFDCLSDSLCDSLSTLNPSIYGKIP